MATTVFLLALLAHLSADFLFQTEGLVRARAQGGIGPYALHGGIVAAAVFAALHPFGPLPAAIFGAIAAALHAPVDWAKDRLRRAAGPPAAPGIFLADQALHLFVLSILARRLEFRSDGRLLSFYRSLWGAHALGAAAGIPAAAGADPERVLLVLAAYVAVVFGGAVLVREVLEAVRVAPAGSEPDRAARGRASRYIGLLERGLILTLILADAASAVGLVMAAKSVARFKELDEKGFAEYYLVGTLASTALAVAGGVLTRAILPHL